MPDFWEFPTVSMGLGPIMAIYQARFNEYLRDRGIKDTSNQKVWAFWATANATSRRRWARSRWPPAKSSTT
jgi:pyruvate dehydrogenase complex dehydrogenase (E1) component